MVILAHDIGEAPNLPAPVQWYVVIAALLLVGVFVLLVVRRTTPVYQSGPDYGGPGIPARGGAVLSALGLLALLVVIGQLVRLIVVVDGGGSRPTIGPVTVWVVFILVVPFASVVIGNWYTALNPWRTLGRLLPNRSSSQRTPGVWPAAAGLALFAWFQLVSATPNDPVVLGLAAVIYTSYLLGSMVAFGVEGGLRGYDIFTIYNRLVSSISPLGQTADGRLVWRGWLRSLPVVPEWRGLWAFVAVMLGSVLFDGLASVEWFPDSQSVVGATVQLFGVIVAVAALVRLAAPRRDAQGYAHALVPLAVALAFAHYFTLILFEGQQLIAAVSDPFGLGWDLFGTADREITYFEIPDVVVWYIQLTSIVIGSATGVVLVHDRALADFGTGAIRAQYAMLALMIGFTTVGILVLAG
jgi:hypothetical protein